MSARAEQPAESKRQQHAPAAAGEDAPNLQNQAPAKARKGAPRRAAQKQAVNVEQTAGTRTEPYDSVIGTLDLSRNARSLVERGAAYAATSRSGAPLSTSFLLIAVVDIGNSSEPNWSPGVIAAALPRDAFARTRAAYLSRKGISPSGPLNDGAELRSSVQLTGYAADALRRAEKIALSTEQSRHVKTRHVVASLLMEDPDREPSGAAERVREAGGDMAALRRELFKYVSALTDADVAAWQAVLGRGGSQLLPSYHPDSALGEDLLDIDADVSAFARLIAAREVAPPLSIGLFGEWGSGKTFFMNRLRASIAALARGARRSEQMQRDLPYYKRIVQIEFNAWHYVEGNLWASLTQHIFDNLRIEPDDPPSVTQRLQQHLLARLTETEAAEQQALEEAQRAERARDAAEQERAAAEERKRVAEAELRRLSVQSVQRLFPLADVQQQLDPLLQSLGLRVAASNAAELQDSLREARSTLQQGRGVLTALLHAPDAQRRLFFISGTLALGFLGTTGLVLLGPLAGKIVSATAATASLPAAAEWLRRQSAWVRTKVDELRKIEEQYDTRVREALATFELEISQREEQVAAAIQDVRAAEQKHADAQRAVEQARREVQQATSVRLLGSFIQDRAASGDYRKHLGIAALVRNDFEKLSGLIEDDNWCLAPAVPGDRPRGDLRKVETFEEELNGADQRINRIILYIDDLDRCPPRRVVEVLQAVHLLLAFPLFVVVVGVDARWIQRALQTRYRELLHRDGNGSADDDQLIGTASTADYLEKIFQIPFWLSPMDKTDASRMLAGLLRTSLAETSTGDANKTGTTDGNADTTAIQPQPLTVAAAAAEIKRLAIQSDELKFMHELAALLGRSPRSLKRFVNVYRLVKAGLTTFEQDHFDDATDGPFRLVLFLIAVDTGAPLAASTVHSALLGAARAQRKRPVHAGLIDALRDETLGYSSDLAAERTDRVRVAQWLAARSNNEFLETTTDVTEWVQRVRRYSFRAVSTGSVVSNNASNKLAEAKLAPPA